MGEAPLTHGAQIANQTGFAFTATQSKFTHAAGNVIVTTSFISPIEVCAYNRIKDGCVKLRVSAQPSNLVLQSLPAAYVAVTTQSTDGTRHRIQVYSDISAGRFLNYVDPLHLIQQESMHQNGSAATMD
jgi:hypothetical protein